ncbi:PEP-utilizing enzyme [Amycolatopsis alkalitolerans]|uniref:PEP-utilizing protein mobile subunit n=1 Tax=Amycolatopsis alkalitolerans TaxID=2547244 RepID=A0A5C4M0M8_9PSEU|nr:PEP-utilizing enzyme [Amycolatopsis alkalitolerans]TNC25173.1 PEP-utilizing protein mobile subunit [Amycolatopsis alkalitolerans]
MSTIVPVDEFVTDEWYPGFKPALDHAPWVVEPFRTFSKADEERFWFLDFHWPRGLTPMGLIWNEDGYSWGTQLAAEALPLPPGRGITQRIAGTHTYAAAIDVTDEWEIGERARRMQANLPRFLENFESIWADRRAEVDNWWEHLRSVDLKSLPLAGLGGYLRKARKFHQRSFEIHFEVMYPLLANYVGFYGACTEMGIDPGEIAKFLQGYDTKIMETDRALNELTRQARTAGLSEVFAATDASKLRSSLAAHGGAASEWLTKFDDFLRVYGYRTEGSCDIALPSWIEDPTPALGMVKTFLQKDGDHDFAAARRAAIEEREAAIDAARSRLTREEQEVFEAGLASCQAANFPWWQDDHNYYIDLRVSLPMRWACQQIAEAVGADASDDTIFLFWPELMQVADGERKYDEFRSLVTARRQYFDHWYQRRASMPKVLGTVPEAVTDPILIEIFGLNQHFLKAVQAAGTDTEVKTLTGVPAAKGSARGTARVLTDADELHRVQPGEILVCESTSPNWTPAFAKIAACICDGGGTLSHAAIVGREYGVPTVTAVGLATVVIKDGDEVEVDGTNGTVTVFRHAEATA